MNHPQAMAVSLLHGWLPITVQGLAALALALGVARRPVRWNLRWLPVGMAVGVGAALLVNWYVQQQKWATDTAPYRFWAWIGLTALAAVVLVAGWRGTRWRQRASSLVAVPLGLLCVALALNLWVGYLPTVGTAWQVLTGAPLGGQIDMATLRQMRDKGVIPAEGTLVSVRIPDDASGFIHRDELVYLPPAWYAANPPPALPALMMIGAEFGHPSDLPTVGVVKVLDKFAAEHGGNAPVVVFVDQSGTFSNDTECVNGPRGNAADHLTKDVVPFIVSTFGVPADPSRWGIAGWSTGGTCALTLAVKYPNLFSVFVDIEGDFGPNAGTKQQTIYRLVDGDEKAWAAFDPTTVMVEHGHYQGMSAWFGISGTESPVYRAGAADPNGVGVPQPSNIWDHTEVAKYMCALASLHGIQCAVVSQPGKHDFPSAVGMFASALPWLAGKLGTPGVPRVPLPGEGPP